MLPCNSTVNSIKIFHCHKKFHLHMTCTEKLQKWHAKGSTANQKAASQVKLKYLRNLLGARRDIAVEAKKKGAAQCKSRV